MIRTIDNFLPEDMYDKLAKRFEQPMMYYGWKAHNQNDPHGHWNHQIGISTHQLNLADISSKLDDQIKEIWDYVSNKYKELKDNKKKYITFIGRLGERRGNLPYLIFFYICS